MIPTLPLALRNRLAATILEALGDREARQRLRALAAAPGSWLEEGDRHLEDRVAARARRASEALAGRPYIAPGEAREALEAAATLFEAGLPFEVHEVLEPHWTCATGETREALQGLIQLAVAYQHLANGNRAGAQSLLAEAADRLHGRMLLGADLEPVARATGEAAVAVGAGRTPQPPAFPRPR